MIEGVLVEPLRVLTNEKGSVRHMLRCDAPYFSTFGEIYFSSVNAGCIKGWKKHKKQTQHFAVVDGNVKFVLFDDRMDSLTKGEVQEIELGNSNYKLLRIPPQVWYSFKAQNNGRATIANCTDIPHDPDECLERDLMDASIPHAWH